MSRNSRKRKPLSGPNRSYLISFGGTMTSLLAFFIVMNALAQDQTGANLNAGTGSFISAIREFGLSGWFREDTSKYPIDKEDHAPQYIVDDGESSDLGGGYGPDEEGNQLRVIDRQREQAQRILTELAQLFALTDSNMASNQVAIDIFDPLGRAPDALPQTAKRVLVRSLPLLQHPDHRLELVVWSPSPSESAFQRSAELADQVRLQVIREFRVEAARARRIESVTRAWPHSDQRRPTLTIVVVKSAVR